MKQVFKRDLNFLETGAGEINVVNLTEFTSENEIDISLFEKSVARVILQNPNLRAIRSVKEGDEKTIIGEKLEFLIFESPVGTYFEYKIQENAWNDDDCISYMENLMKFGEANFRCILVKSNACNSAACSDFNYHLMVVFNHSVADGTSGMILTNQIFSLYDEAIKNSDVLEGEINAEIVKTWQAAIQPNNPNGEKNYEKIQSEIDAGQANVKNFLIPYSFEMKGRNAHVLRKGTAAGLQAFKTACKNNGVTIGIGLITAVHWAMAKFDSSRDLFGYADVNLRHRLGDGADKYKGVSCNIGMFKLAFDGKFDFDSGSVNFWELAQALKKNIDMQMADGNQFVFHRITEDRIMSSKEDLIDINISSIGHYPFATKFQNSGIKMNGNWTSMSGKISPDLGSCVLLVQSLEMQCYTVTYYNEGDNKAKATDFINMVVDLCENQMGSNENLKFSDWKPIISSAN